MQIHVISYSFMILNHIQINSQFWNLLMLKIWLWFFFWTIGIGSKNETHLYTLSSLTHQRWLHDLVVNAALHGLVDDHGVGDYAGGSRHRIGHLLVDGQRSLRDQDGEKDVASEDVKVPR